MLQKFLSSLTFSSAAIKLKIKNRWEGPESASFSFNNYGTVCLSVVNHIAGDQTNVDEAFTYTIQ
jgi:hypothetical protein